MKLTTEQKLTRTRGHIRRWETRIKRAANKLAAYRAHETRLMKKHRAEIAEQIRKPDPAGAGTTGRAFDLE